MRSLTRSQRWIIGVGLLVLSLAAVVLSPELRRRLENAYLGVPVALFVNNLRPYLYARDDRECLEELRASGQPFQRVSEENFTPDCPVVYPVAIRRPLRAKRYMSCRLALAFQAYHREALQPLAERLLHRKLIGVGDLGVRSCRNMGGHRALLSEHAYANAIDLSHFDFEGGLAIDVERDWHGGGEKSLFLREAAKAACEYFNMVISPDHDEDHRDHIHADMGLSEGCKVDDRPAGASKPPARG